MFPRAVAEGIHLALEAHRRGLLDEAALDLVLRYYDAEGARDPAPAEDVLVRLGGVDPASVVGLLTAAGLAPAAPARADLPFVSPRLTLTERLGAGAMGAVYRAHDRVLGRDVAVKVVHPERLAGSEATRLLARFAREAKAMARVRHPAVVPLHDAGLDPAGRPYLVMEYVAGQSLARMLEEPRDWREVVAWGRTLAEALQACHDIGVIHRDVKPGNILIDDRRRPHLTDFGVALDAAAQTRLTADRGGMVGTLAYMAPEQITGQGADGRADVYALGATLFEALTGTPPFDGPAVVLLRRALEGEAPPLRGLRPDLPEDLDTVVATCLARSPTERYATAQALALDLARVLADDPVVARRPGRVGRLRRFVRRHRRVITLTATSGLVATMAASGLALHARSVRYAAQAGEIEAARAIDDLAQAEEALAGLVSAAVSPDLAERARAARQQVRRRFHVAAASDALARLQAALVEAEELRTSASQLESRVDPAVPFGRSPEKRARAEALRAAQGAERRAEAARRDCEQALAQAVSAAPGPEVEALRASLLLTQARSLEERDPDGAEALFAQAAAADQAADCALADRLRPALLDLTSEPPAHITIRRYALDLTEGRMLAGEAPVASSTQSLRLELPTGEYLVEVTADGYLEVRLPLLLRRGDQRRLALRLVPATALGPARGLVRWVPGGPARWGPDLESRHEVEDCLMRVREVSRAEWRAYLRAREDAPALLPSGWTGSIEDLFAPGARQGPISGITRDHARAYVDWLTEELARARVPYVARLPRLAEHHRATRGELHWPYPWGRDFDASFCRCGPSSGTISESEITADASPFGILDLAGSQAEFTDDDLPRESGASVIVFGGDLTSSPSVVEFSVTRRSLVETTYRHATVGFRYVLVPRDTPLPEPPRTAARANQAYLAANEAEQRGDLAAAQRLATQAIDAAPLEAALWCTRALIRLRRDDTWGAIWDLTRALDLKPDSQPLWIYRSRAHARDLSFAEAVADLDRAIELAPGDASVWAERAVRRALLDEDPAGPIADLEEALRLDPSSELAPTWRAQLAECKAEQARRAAARDE